MIERLQNIEKRYNYLNDKLIDPNVTADIKQTMEISKEQANLSDAYDMYQEYKKLTKDIEDTRNLLKDKDLGRDGKRRTCWFRNKF